MPFSPDPPSLSQAVAQLIAERGLIRTQAENELSRVWKQAVGPAAAEQTRPLKVMRGVLHVEVGNAPLLAELTTFREQDILQQLSQIAPHLKVRGLKLKLKGLR